MIWAHPGPGDRPFSSETCGAVQRLPNGNTLIVETQFGRAFEVTREGETVWEFVSPHVLGGHVARLFDLDRVAREEVAWLGGADVAP